MPRPVKRQKLSPPESSEAEAQSGSDFDGVSSDGDSDWDIEAAYARKAQQKQKAQSTRLPIKTSEGWVEQAAAPVQVDEEVDESAEEQDGEEAVEEEEPESELLPREQIVQAKEQLARLASQITEDPEEKIGSLKELAEIAHSKNNTIRKLALVTQSAVFRDIIPGYRIRPVSEDEMKEKLSKDVKKLRNYEQGLVRSYQKYVQHLDLLTKKRNADDGAGVYSVALSCACTMLTERPHFNFRGDLIQILVRRLSIIGSMDADFTKCCTAIETLFRDDDEGHASLDAVTNLTKMIKARNFKINEPVLNTFLQLRLLSEFSGKASADKVDKAADERQRLTGKKKEEKVFRTKKTRKHLKELKKVEKEMREADATVGQEENERMQAEMLKLVFATYFRILKARSSKLMGATLEGLARYAHLINQDFFGDILEALKDLIRASEATEDAEEEDEEIEGEPSRDLLRESLLCVITAFALLQGQDGRSAGSTLHIDLDFFITRLYRSLHNAAMDPDIELGASSLHLPDPHADYKQSNRLRSKVNIQTTTVLLIRSLNSVLLPTHAIRAVPPSRLAAFIKQCYLIALQLPEKSCMALLSLLEKVTKVHGRKVAGLWNSEERKGDGVFNPVAKEIEGSNPFTATIWEGEILRRHYCPKVRAMHRAVENNVRNA